MRKTVMRNNGFICNMFDGRLETCLSLIPCHILPARRPTEKKVRRYFLENGASRLACGGRDGWGAVSDYYSRFSILGVDYRVAANDSQDSTIILRMSETYILVSMAG